MKTQLTTTKSTTLALSKTKSLMGITAKILEGKGTALAKAEPSQELTTHEGIVMMGGLMWEKESREMDWYDAIEYAKNLRLGGYDDWRLPTVEELGSVVTLCGGEVTSWGYDDHLEETDRNLKNKTYEEAYKKLGFTFRNYWSSPNYGGYSGHAWDVYFNGGIQSNNGESDSIYVRCVRAGQ